MKVEELEQMRREYQRLSELRSKLLGELEILQKQLEEVEAEIKNLVGNEDLDAAIASLEAEIERESEALARKIEEIKEVLNEIAGART